MTAIGDGSPAASTPASGDAVILLHGLARTSASMARMSRALTEAGYVVLNVDYPSREKPVVELSETVIPAAVGQCRPGGSGRIHFVTHSMGGILVRCFLQRHTLAALGRVVMLSPPNQGSEVVDKLVHLPGFRLLNGPAGRQLGTGPGSLPKRLGPADFDLGIITGSRSFNPVLSCLIPGQNDGKVAVERAKLAGMRDFMVLPHSHPFIMNSREAIRQTLFFLAHGRFAPKLKAQG